MSKNWLVARDDQGQKIKAWTKEHFLCELVMVEAAAILCAVELATLGSSIALLLKVMSQRRLNSIRSRCKTQFYTLQS
jgi:hypothetical protein